MSPELDRELCERYPLIFADRHASMTQTAMCWGFECHDGWYWLVDALCEELQRETNYCEGPQVVAAQVKDKFGSLRFYVRGPLHGASENQRAMIGFAQALSLRVCEICGAPTPRDGAPAPDVRLETRCAKHRAR